MVSSSSSRCCSTTGLGSVRGFGGRMTGRREDGGEQERAPDGAANATLRTDAHARTVIDGRRTVAQLLCRRWGGCSGSESNQLHADFQSAALPSELPERGAGIS